MTRHTMSLVHGMKIRRFGDIQAILQDTDCSSGVTAPRNDQSPIGKFIPSLLHSDQTHKKTSSNRDKGEAVILLRRVFIFYGLAID